MPSDVVLTSALRNNLLSLQGSQRSAGDSRGAGPEGNSANSSQQSPESVLAPQSLNKRASDLQSVLDSVNQSIRTLEVAGNSATKLSELLTQAEAFASTALADLKTQNTPDYSALGREATAILTRIDQVIGDSSYKGTNLLVGDSVETFFTENTRRPFITEGADLSTTALGLADVNFSSAVDIEAFISNIHSARGLVRDLQQSLAADLSEIQTRRDFTQETISTLNTGAEGLVVRDQSEEAANLLALQIRQDLSASDASLASDKQQSIFKLF